VTGIRFQEQQEWLFASGRRRFQWWHSERGNSNWLHCTVSCPNSRH